MTGGDALVEVLNGTVNPSGKLTDTWPVNFDDNPDTNEYVADNLTTTEFTIAMLASRGWTNQEIADYMKITLRTVKQHMTCIFNKISISNRKQLKEYMLR